MSDPIQWADGSVEEWDKDKDNLKIVKPSLDNVKSNISAIATQGAITLNKVRNILPEPPEQLVEGVDWAYKNSPLGIADQGAQLLGDDVSRFLINKGAPNWVGGAAALGIGLATPGFGPIKGVGGLDKARKVAIKATKNTKGINFFPPNQTLQPNYATVGPGNLQINPQTTNIKPNNSLMIKGVKGSDNVLPTLSPEDQIIRDTFPRIKSKHDKSVIEALSGNPTGAAAELKDLVLKQSKLLEHSPTLKLPNGREVKVTRLVKGEAQELANRISDLKKQLNLSAPSKYDQIAGYYVEGESLFRLNSKGKLVKVQDNIDRNILEKLWPIDESQKTARQLQTAAREKHHFRILEPSKIFNQIKDEAGNWVQRSQKQIDNVTARLQKDGVFIGNQDLNEVFQTKAAHIGAGGNRYGSHAQLRTLTDIQGRTLADADFLKVVNKTDGKTVWVKQVKNKKGIITDFVTEKGDKIKPSHIGEALEYKVGGRTYDPKAMHGFSKEGIEYISKIKGDDELYDAMKLYYEINDEAYKGAAGLASKLVDAGVQVDDLTKTLVKEFSPETQNWINHLLTLPEYSRDTRLLQALIRNSEDLLTLPKYKNNLKLQSLAKNIQRGLDSKTGLEQKLQINR